MHRPSPGWSGCLPALRTGRPSATGYVGLSAFGFLVAAACLLLEGLLLWFGRGPSILAGIMMLDLVSRMLMFLVIGLGDGLGRISRHLRRGNARQLRHQWAADGFDWPSPPRGASFRHLIAGLVQLARIEKLEAPAVMRSNSKAILPSPWRLQSSSPYRQLPHPSSAECLLTAKPPMARW